MYLNSVIAVILVCIDNLCVVDSGSVCNLVSAVVKVSLFVMSSVYVVFLVCIELCVVVSWFVLQADVLLCPGLY